MPPNDQYPDKDREEGEMEQIHEALDRKDKKIEEEFALLRQKFLDQAEQKMDSLHQKNDILDEIEQIRKMYVDLKQQNSELRTVQNVLNTKLEAKSRLNEHLEEKCANILIEKSNILVHNKLFHRQEEKHKAEVDALNSQKIQLERNIVDLDEKYQKALNAHANFDNDFKKKVKELKKLADEFRKHKKETKQLLDEKNLLIKEYEERVRKLNDQKQQQVAMIDKEREDIENELGIAKAQLKILELRENFYKNKAEKLLVQKKFLVKQIENNLETMNNEYNKLRDQEHQKDFMISVKKSNKNVQEVYFS